MDLTEIHQAQIARFMGFFKNKRQNFTTERNVLDEQFESDNLSDDTAIFNTDNVQGLLKEYQRQSASQANEELTKIAKLAAVYCTELMRVGQASGLNLQTEDISVVEDQNRIDHVNALTTMKHAPIPSAPKNAMLPTLGGGAAASDPAMMQKLQDAEEETRKMTERYQSMQNQVTSLLQERSSMSTELDNVRNNFSELRNNMAATGADMASQQHAAQLEAQVYQSQSAIANKNAEIDAMRRDHESRIGDSSQFKQLKTIIKEKNNQIKTLRAHLSSVGVNMDGGGMDLAADSD